MIAKFYCVGIFLFLVNPLLARSSKSSIRAEETDLVLVQIVFRHGDRTPTGVYPNDPYGPKIWDKYGGLGELSQKGMQQHYAYGEYLRERYGGFLNKTYNVKRVSVKSTTYDRTIMSAESLVASLYRPVDFQIWNPDLLWQPIPIVTANLDALFIPSCPRYNQLVAQVIKSDEFIETNNKYKDLNDIADKYSGLKNNTILTLGGITDTSFVEKNFNYTVPQWIEDNYKTLLEVTDLAYHFGYNTVEMARLFSGGVLNEMKNNIKSKVNGTSTLDLALFSSHDTYVMSFIKLLELSERLYQPPYVSSVTLELRKSKTSADYFVQAFIKNNTANQEINSFLVSIAGCDLMCPLSQFLDIISNRIVDNPTVDCAIQTSSNTLKPTSNLLKSWTFMMSLGFAFVASLLVISLAIDTYRKTFRQKSSYMRQEL